MGTATAEQLKAVVSFAEFYPIYLGEHQDRTCRRLHFVRSTLSLACLAALLAPAGSPSCCWHC